MVRNTKLPLPKTKLLYYRNWTPWTATKELIEMFPVIKLAVNRKGGLYVHGTNKLPLMFRERLQSWFTSRKRFAQLTRTGLHFVQNVIVVDFIEMERLLKPSTHSSEIQERMVLDGVVHPLDVPSKASIILIIEIRSSHVSQKAKCYTVGISNSK